MSKTWTARRGAQRGQTLVVAVIILGVLLILGFVFATVVAQNIRASGRGLSRSASVDLAEAGIRLAHYQMLNSELGADWRPDLTELGSGDLTKDPDALYLRPPSGFFFPLRNAPPGTQRPDLGGPDGLGPYSRFEFQGGRALVRVRYAPSDLDPFGTQGGALRQKGRAKSFLIIESVGRPQRVDPNDPSTLLSQAVRIRNFGSQAAFERELGRMRQLDAQLRESFKRIAFATIGIIESGRYITNKYRVGREAELGVPTEPASGQSGPERDGLGIRYEGRPVEVETVWGGELDASTGQLLATGTGSLWSNASLLIHGLHRILVNPEIGDQWAVAGELRGANDRALLAITRFAGGTSQSRTLGFQTTPFSYNSRRGTFDTFGGVLRDGRFETDGAGYTRAIARKEPPSILRVDPANGLNRYLQMTRNSGAIVGGVNVGRYGYGRGVYVDARERANVASDVQQQIDVLRSLPYDWLNPNNPTSIAWQGPFYRPIAPFLRLLPDGFEIIRDSRSRQAFWRRPDGSPTNQSTLRFRLRRIGNVTFVIDGITAPDLIGRPNLSDQDFLTNGRPFNGVIYFEGDVRTRGVIPTNHQLTVVSQGTIYIEGSITKGVVDETGQLLSTPSRSALALLARDYVALNTTAFFAPGPGENPQAKKTDILPDTPNPVEILPDQTLGLTAQFLLNPLTPGTLGGNRWNPSTWRPYALQYTAAGTGQALRTQMIYTQAAENGGPAFVSLTIEPFTFANTAGASGASPYLFRRILDFASAGQVLVNAASGFYGGADNIPIYGLGNPGLNAYPRFESMSLPLVNDQTPLVYSTVTRQMGALGNNTEGSFALAVQDETRFEIRVNGIGNFATQNYVLGRAAIVPHDVRIEAALFAEEGSFFVIPGPPFNINPEDTREAFNARAAQVGLDQALRERFERFGNAPEVPFYNEPVAVRISIVGAVSENMPAPASQQAAWQRRWGWIPRFIGATRLPVPSQWVPQGVVLNTDPSSNAGVITVPNLIIAYDPMLALGSADGVNPVRVSPDGLWVLPPMPRLPVSPTLAYFGEVNP